MSRPVSIDQIPTPALLLDLDIFEGNLSRVASQAKQAGKKLRPHVKAHKCVEIARRQIAAGACGVCVATMAEAEMIAGARISGILLTSPVADPRKMARIVKTGAMVVVDHVQQVAWYQDAAKSQSKSVDVLIDLDTGDHRTGAQPGEQAMGVARAVVAASNLRLRGIQAYSVSGSHAAGEERLRNSESTYRIAAEVRDALARDGMATEILSGGSTGTVEVDCKIAAVTELQAGSYVVMDMAYAKLGVAYGRPMTILTTVISASHAAFVTVDGGYKAFAADRGYGPEAVDLPGSKYRWGGDEFGYVDLEAVDRKPKLGDRIGFVAPHCDPTVNLYDRIYACRGDRVEDVWSVMDRLR